MNPLCVLINLTVANTELTIIAHTQLFIKINMRKLIFLTLVIMSVTATAFILKASKKEAEPTEQAPNIIYIMADQLRYDALGYSGNYKAVTPNLDKLAANSMNFRNCVSSTPVCAPYRASLITGKYTSSTGMVINEMRLNPNQTSIANVLDDHGYQTGYIGKWHLWADHPARHTTVDEYIPAGPYRMGFNGLWNAYNFHHENYNTSYYNNSPQPQTYKKDYEPEAQFDMAIDYIKDHKNDKKPFALFLSVGIPHDPWIKSNVPSKYYDLFKNVDFKLPANWKNIPDPYMDRNTDKAAWLSDWKMRLPEMMRVYYAMVASLDDNMGHLMEALDKEGLSKNTIVVFTTDHGEMFGENGRVFKLTFYESAARVPFLIRWPGHIPEGVQSDVLLNTPDIMPTLLGLTSLPIPKSVEGTDLSHACLGEPGPQPDFAFMQGMGHTYLWQNGFEWRAVRDKRFTFARYLRDGSEVLFDNLKDPMQQHNLIADAYYKNVRDALKHKMKAKMSSLNDEFKPCTWYRDHWTDGNRNIIASAKGKF
jgi:arylsulfatase A-like enzyme